MASHLAQSKLKSWLPNSPVLSCSSLALRPHLLLFCSLFSPRWRPGLLCVVMQCVPWTKAPVGEKSSPYFVKPLRRGCSCPKTQWYQSGQQRLCWPPRTASDTMAQPHPGLCLQLSLPRTVSLHVHMPTSFGSLLKTHLWAMPCKPCPSLYFLSPFSASFFLNTGHETRCIFYHLSDLSVFPPLKCKLLFISSVQ